MKMTFVLRRWFVPSGLTSKLEIRIDLWWNFVPSFALCQIQTKPLNLITSNYLSGLKMGNRLGPKIPSLKTFHCMHFEGLLKHAGMQENCWPDLSQISNNTDLANWKKRLWSVQWSIFNVANTQKCHDNWNFGSKHYQHELIVIYIPKARSVYNLKWKVMRQRLSRFLMSFK